MEFTDAQIRDKIRDLERKHKRAEQNREKWAAAAEELAAKLAAFKVVMAELSAEPEGTQRTPRASTMAGTIANAVETLAGVDITIHTVRHAMGEQAKGMPSQQISGALIKMAADAGHPLRQIEKGAGNRPSVYCLRGQDESTTEEDSDDNTAVLGWPAQPRTQDAP